MNNTFVKRQPVPFGKYLLLDRVNIGGMAEIWRGKRFGLGGFEQLVAIKRILPNIAEDGEFVAMFIDEAKITAHLAHANIARIYELGSIHRNYFIAMEYIAGKDLRAIFDRCRQRGEPLPPSLGCYIIARVCEGLDYAHRRKDGEGRDMNIVHRDVSPQNVLISYEGEVKLIDFGIAKAANKANQTQAGILKGKFGYMSPEQVRSQPIDRRSDIFAAGICLYELFTNERLFVGDSDYAVLEKVRNATIPPPSSLNPSVSPELDRITLKALSRELETRYQHASELVDDLQKFLITSEARVGRKDLTDYMVRAFAEDLEREKARAQDYADLKPPESMLAALKEAGPPTELTATVPAATETDYPTQHAAHTDTTGTGTTPSFPSVAAAGELAGQATVEKTASAAAAPEPTVAMRPDPGRVTGPGRQAPARTESRAWLPQRNSPQMRVLAALAGLVVLLFGLTLYFAVRKPPNGYLYLELPANIHGKARVNVNGEDLGVRSEWPIVYRTPAGNALVVVTMEGYKAFRTSVEVKEGGDTTPVLVALEKETPMEKAVIVTVPEQAKVVLNGQVAKEESSSEPYIADLLHGSTATLEISAAGYKTYQGKFLVEGGAKPQVVHVRLEPQTVELNVSSDPPAATIWLNGQNMGLTPRRLEVSELPPEVLLQKHCYVPLRLTPEANLPTQSLSGKLTRSPSCR